MSNCTAKSIEVEIEVRNRISSTQSLLSHISFLLGIEKKTSTSDVPIYGILFTIVFANCKYFFLRKFFTLIHITDSRERAQKKMREGWGGVG